MNHVNENIVINYFTSLARRNPRKTIFAIEASLFTFLKIGSKCNCLCVDGFSLEDIRGKFSSAEKD